MHAPKCMENVGILSSKNMHCHAFVSVGVYTFTQVFKGDSHEIKYMYMDLSEIQTPNPDF
jgi:hypothetical protein